MGDHLDASVGSSGEEARRNLRGQNLSLDMISWEALNDIAGREKLSVMELLSSVRVSAQNKSLKSATRLFILKYYREMASRSLQAAASK